MRLLIPLVFISLLLSCKDEEKANYLNEVSSIEQELDSLESIVNDTTRRNSTMVNLNVRNTIIKVKKNYLPDTIDYSVANMMNDYKEIRKAISSNSGNLAKAKQAIPEVKQKIEDLKHDIKNGVGERERYKEYIDFEQNKIEDIKNVLDYYIKTNNKFYDRYDSLHPIVTNFADSLLNAKND
jgi:predicted  nucleic acid-binding Zn-ribbon protein